jgi:hypothetical protein
MTISEAFRSPYSGYHIGWQILGMLIPLGGLILFALPFCFGKQWFSTEDKGIFVKSFALAEELPCYENNQKVGNAESPSKA